MMRDETRGLGASYQRYTLPPVGNCTLPRRSLYIVCHIHAKKCKGLLAVLGTVKFLGIGNPVLLSKFSYARAHHLFQFIHPADELALMAEQRFNLFVHGLRDIDKVIAKWCSHNI